MNTARTRFLGRRTVAAVALVGLALAGFGPAAGGAAAQPGDAPALPSLSQVAWNGPAPSWDGLRGKTVIVLVYATWCPICNKWSGQFFSQLKEAIQDKPVVVLAVNADERSAGVLPYLKERQFFAPNIIHGYDPRMPAQLGFNSNLFRYAWIGPEGQMKSSGSAGSYFGGEAQREFVLAKKLAEDESLGEFRVITPDMPEQLKAILWPLELGRDVDERQLRSARRELSPALQEAWDEAIDRYLSGRLEQAERLAEGTVPERLKAAAIAQGLASSFKLSDQGRAARKILLELNSDTQLRKEQKAKEYYDKAQNAGPRRKQLLEVVARRFEGTHYGDLAAEQAASP